MKLLKKLMLLMLVVTGFSSCVVSGYYGPAPYRYRPYHSRYHGWGYYHHRQYNSYHGGKHHYYGRPSRHFGPR